MIRRYFLLTAACLALVACQNGGFHPVKATETWFGSHKTQLKATGALIAQSAAQIAERDVFSNSQGVEDALLKQFNTQGFASAFNTLEAALPNIAISEIPDFVVKLRAIWLGPQDHYSKLAADLATLIQNNLAAEEKRLGRKLLPDEATQIIEAVKQGLSTATASPTAPVAPSPAPAAPEPTPIPSTVNQGP